jgi:Fe-S oxidoreductase
MKQEDFTRITERCFHGAPASCSFACPFGLDIRNFMERAREGRWGLAYKILRNAVIFPAVVCEICPAPCETECQRRSIGDEAVNIRGVEAAAVAFAKERSKAPESYRIPPKTERIAVVGAGPAGLSCALNLAQKRYPVTVFEARAEKGGSLAEHPKKALFTEDFDLQFSGTDAEFRLNTELQSLEELSDYDAVYLATGKDGADFGTPAGGGCGPYFPEGRTKPAVFIGGGARGAETMRAIADGARVSRAMEVYFQTGARGDADAAAGEKGRIHYLDHEGTPRAPRVAPADGVSYTAEEAQDEARRCLLCDCTACLDACEMLRSYSKWPQKVAIEAFVDLKANPPFSSRTQARETYSCSMCGVCRSVCPEDIDMGKLFLLSREGRRESGKYPYAFHDFWLRDMDFAAGEAAYAAPPPGRSDAGYVFFPGCKLASSGDRGVHRAASAARRMLADHEAGIVLNCCGAPALWAGEREKFKAHTAKLRAAWESLGKPTFIFACAYCSKVFSEYLPEIGRTSVYELLADAPARDGEQQGEAPGGPSAARTEENAELTPPQPPGAGQTFAVFDPCAARTDKGLSAAVRRLARSRGVVTEELGEKNRCCGWGGHMSAPNPGLYETMLDARAAMSDRPYLVYCANCEDAFLRKGKECAHLLDLVFTDEYGEDAASESPLARGEAAAARVTKLPHLQEKRARARELKKELAPLYGRPAGEMNAAADAGDAADHAAGGGSVAPPCGIALRIPGEVRSHMDAALMLDEDVAETILEAERRDDKFTESEGGSSLACLVKPNVTYWVEYRAVGPGAYEVYNVYSHRMRFEAD